MSIPICTENLIRMEVGPESRKLIGDRAPLVRSGRLRLAVQIKRAA